MHVMNLVAMVIGYLSIAFTLGIVLAMIVCWVAGVTQRPENIEKAAGAKASPRPASPEPFRIIQGARQQGKTAALSLVRGGRLQQ